MRNGFDYMGFGLRLYSLRDERGWTLERAASKIGCAPCSLCIWESGKQAPQLRHIANICKAYNASADWLLGVTR